MAVVMVVVDDKFGVPAQANRAVAVVQVAEFLYLLLCYSIARRC